jgi:hypothetical protein
MHGRFVSEDRQSWYRIDGIGWGLIDPAEPWSHIDYWGDHPVIHLQRLLEAAQDREPTLLADAWNRALFSFADVPYRLKPHAEQVAQPKDTVVFDTAAHARSSARSASAATAGWSATTSTRRCWPRWARSSPASCSPRPAA